MAGNHYELRFDALRLQDLLRGFLNQVMLEAPAAKDLKLEVEIDKRTGKLDALKVRWYAEDSEVTFDATEADIDASELD